MTDKYIIPKKSLGQHWLYDDASLLAMCDLSQISKADLVVEIGPGLGTLTEKLLAKAKKVIAVEFDDQLAKSLGKKITSERLVVVNQDILKFNFEQLPTGYKVCANIPYYLTSNLIRILTELNNKPQIVTLLIQKEVAERICSRPGQMSLLSVWAQLNYDCSLGPVVKADLFTPPPKVDSQIVVLKRKETSLLLGQDAKKLSRVIRAGFSNKRKTLLNCISSGMNMPKNEASKILNTSSISPNTRAQELSLEQWISLAKVI